MKYFSAFFTFQINFIIKKDIASEQKKNIKLPN